MHVSGGDTAHSSEGAYHKWAAAGHRRAISQLSVGIPTPREDDPVIPRGKRVVSANGDAGDPSQARDLSRSVSAGGAAITQLVEVVAPPGPHRAVALERHAVSVAGPDGHNAA